MENNNLYFTYCSIENEINLIEKRINQKDNQLKILIYNSGPKDVKAQQYDQIKSGSKRVVNLLDFYSDIEELQNKIEEDKNILENKYEDLAKLELLIKKLVVGSNENMELKVFYYNHIKGYSLLELSEKLYYINTFGDKKRYSYAYIRQLNSQIKKNIEFNFGKSEYKDIKNEKRKQKALMEASI